MDTNIGIVSVPPPFRCATHVYRPTDACQECITLLSYRNHMRLLAPPSVEARDSLFLYPPLYRSFLGRRNLITGSPDIVAIAEKSLDRRPHCQELNIRPPSGVQGSLVGTACIKEVFAMLEFYIQPLELTGCQKLGTGRGGGLEFGTQLTTDGSIS